MVMFSFVLQLPKLMWCLECLIFNVGLDFNFNLVYGCLGFFFLFFQAK